MKFISLFSDKANISYSYKKRNTNNAFEPNLDTEEVSAESYNSSNGNLFFGRPISYKGNKLMNSSADIVITLDRRYFIDRVALKLTEKSSVGGICVLDSSGKNIASLSAAECNDKEILTLNVGWYAESLTLRIDGCYSNAGIEKLEIYAAYDIENTIYPTPEKVTYSEGILPFENISSISAKGQLVPAAEYLSELLQSLMGKKLPITSEGGEIALSLSEREDDGYDLEISDNGCIISAKEKRSFFYAANTLMQLCEKKGIKKASVCDTPMMEIRGFHFALPSRTDMPFIKNIIKDLLVPMRYNTVFIQISGAMKYDNYPEIGEMWLRSCEKYKNGEWPKPAHYDFIGHDVLEKEEIAELCDYIRSFGLEIVPEIQCLSHSQYITTAYPFLAEIEYTPEEEINIFGADEKPSVFYHHNMCPSHPQYYDYVFGIAKEVIDLFKPEKYVHMGHDEVYTIGKCQKCREKGGAAIYAEEVTKLNDFVKSMGLQLMLWSDMLQNKRYSVPEAIDLVPKDIIMLDFTWYFDLDKDIEDKLLAKDFKVMMGNMYSSHYTRYNSRSRKKGIIGAEVSTWVDCNEHSYAYEGKLYDLAYSANTMWSADYDTEYRAVYNEIVKERLWKLRQKIGDFDGEAPRETIDINGSLRNIPHDLIWNIPYDNAVRVSPENQTYSIDASKYSELVSVVQATDIPSDRIMWTPAKEIGEYTLEYEDGSSFSSPILYGDDILNYSVKYGNPIPSVLFRHEGYTGTYTSRPICGKDANGKDYTLFEKFIKNPYPNKKIRKITAKHNANTDAQIIIFNIKA